MVEPASVIVVDDHALFRMGVLQTIALNENLRVVAEGASKQDSLDLVARHHPTIALLDILKGIAANELLDALTTVQRGSTYLAPTLGSKLVAAMRGHTQPRTDGNPLTALSAKERHVLECVGRGMGNQAIAEATGTTLRTVKFHVSRLLKKVQAKNRVELALIAQKAADVSGKE
jgi:DNA-binding NarL/FixJ family response regulator